jgi:hypothetical protein
MKNAGIPRQKRDLIFPRIRQNENGIQDLPKVALIRVVKGMSEL